MVKQARHSVRANVKVSGLRVTSRQHWRNLFGCRGQRMKMTKEDLHEMVFQLDYAKNKTKQKTGS